MSVVVIGSYAKALVITADRIPGEGETLLGSDYRETYGGKGSDMAVQAARLGASVAYVGVVGDDTHGREFTELMRSEKIDVTGLRVDPGKPTGVGIIIKDTRGHNAIVVDMGANGLFGKADVDASEPILKGAKVALAQLEIPLETALYGLAKAKATGAVTILNPAPARDLRNADLSAVDIVTPNETEARIVAGLPPEADVPLSDIAAILLDRGCRAVVMTLGDAGARVFTREGSTAIAPCPVDVVDSNGAGDSFNAGLAVALSEGKSLPDAARFANAVAGLCCTRWETVPSYHNRNEVDAFLAAQ
ncbi:Ribokinase [Pleomorphomonas sp. T1.2MG-36]|uniref:ribokinase n=1 Tax=Pleomorphomonas sp. T1.2MG-36 TaxID=3041167 RepID=UPI0024778B50|nr:ribokinase [Pleomorphomonas sp. T1.2MG-36]CAI9409231.1 Ribokinase [Pleomorphomonas sp. T1.2MG-36]